VGFNFVPGSSPSSVDLNFVEVVEVSSGPSVIFVASDFSWDSEHESVDSGKVFAYVNLLKFGGSVKVDMVESFFEVSGAEIEFMAASHFLGGFDGLAVEEDLSAAVEVALELEAIGLLWVGVGEFGSE